jgi:hypothetical protein
MNYLAEASFTIPMGWALTGFLSLCGLVAGMGKLIFSMCMWRIKALEKEVARLSRGCGVINCHWRSVAAPVSDSTSDLIPQ